MRALNSSAWYINYLNFGSQCLLVLRAAMYVKVFGRYKVYSSDYAFLFNFGFRGGNYLMRVVGVVSI